MKVVALPSTTQRNITTLQKLAALAAVLAV